MALRKTEGTGNLKVEGLGLEEAMDLSYDRLRHDDDDDDDNDDAK